jgi:hypothetical protein
MSRLDGRPEVVARPYSCQFANCNYTTAYTSHLTVRKPPAAPGAAVGAPAWLLGRG